MPKSFEIIKKTPECQESFEKIKKTLTSDISLTHYDPTLDIIVASDATHTASVLAFSINNKMAREKLWHTHLDPYYQLRSNIPK